MLFQFARNHNKNNNISTKSVVKKSEMKTSQVVVVARDARDEFLSRIRKGNKKGIVSNDDVFPFSLFLLSHKIKITTVFRGPLA